MGSDAASKSPQKNLLNYLSGQGRAGITATYTVLRMDVISGFCPEPS